MNFIRNIVTDYLLLECITFITFQGQGFTENIFLKIPLYSANGFQVIQEYSI